MKKRLTIGIVRDRVSKEISEIAAQGHNAARMASEGYLGGYRDGLDDALLFLSGVRPSRRGWWGKPGDGDSGS